MFRQGDVLLVPCSASEVPEAATTVKRDAGRVVLAYGEVTGHAHAITAPKARLVEVGAARFLHIPVECDLKHEEHYPITLPVGHYRVVRQVEYTPEAVVNVLD